VTRKRHPRPDDMMRGIKFVKLATFHDLAIAEAIQAALREGGIGAVIINDEEYQSRPAQERAEVTSLSGFRIEVPEPTVEKARAILQDLTKDET
jgi:hypothetical protein